MVLIILMAYLCFIFVLLLNKRKDNEEAEMFHHQIDEEFKQLREYAEEHIKAETAKKRKQAEERKRIFDDILKERR